ncbi:MAG TPA: vWA domain-containing protein, partial [Planctomycetaceae bacterium]
MPPIKFEWTSWTLAVSLIGVVVTAGFCWAAWRRSGYRPSFGLLELLRLVIVCLAAVLFNQPEWFEEYRPDEKPSVAVLWDSSPSMETRDFLQSGPGNSQPVTRQEGITPLIDPAAWKKLEERMDVHIEPFSPPRPGHGSDLYDPLANAREKFRNLRGILLISDGDWNEGRPPVEAALRLRLKGIPVFTVAAGSDIRLPDIELLSLDAPTFGVAGKSVRIPITVESAMPRDYMTTVTLKTSDGDEVTKELKILPMGRTSDSILWKPKTTGDFTVSLEIPKHADETLVDNNKLSAPISIREEKLRVLVVESYPRWEYRYLRNALSRDPGIDLACLLFHPGLSKVGGGNKDYIKQFPGGLDELSKFDVVFLGDVGVEEGQLTLEHCRLLKGLVEHQASGLVFMPGVQGREFSLLETDLGDLCPVVLDAAQPGGWGSRTPSHFELTEMGRRSLLTKLADTQDDNIEVWEGLPGFQWHAPVLRAKAGSDVLAVHKDAANEYGRLPLLATRTFGAGKVLFMGTDGAWRWRKGVEDKYHYRFWGQVVRWMAYQRNMAKGETLRLFYTPDQPQMKQAVALHAIVMEK